MYISVSTGVRRAIVSVVTRPDDLKCSSEGQGRRTMAQDAADSASEMVKLISAEGHEFYISKKCAMVSGTIRAMLSGQFTESKGEITFPDISAPILEKVCQYMYYKTMYTDSTSRFPDFVIEPEVAMELLMAAKRLIPEESPDWRRERLPMYWFPQFLAPRRARSLLQLAIYAKSIYSALFFYPLSGVLLIEKIRLLDYHTSLGRGLHVTAFIFLLCSDAARYWLGTHGNLRCQVFHLTAFLFLSICPMLPALLFFAYFAQHTLTFDVISGAIMIVLMCVEWIFAAFVLREILRQETTRFVRLRDAVKAHEMDTWSDQDAIAAA